LITMILKKGSKGEEVKKLQAKLGLSADGVFGPGTEAKLKEWQMKNGLSADGIAGPATLSKLGVSSTPVLQIVKEDVIIPKGGPIDLSRLKGHIPESVISQIPTVMEKFQINTPLRLAHFLAQCGHESGGFRAVQENLNYSADGLKRIFPKYFPGNLAESYARNPEKIASKVYGGRMGNGDETTKEGFKFRGRGYIQLTGKSNYTAFAKSIGEDTVANPDLVATKYPLASAAWFFSKNGLNSIADRGADSATVTAVTKRVNGGTIGLADRIKHFNEYYKLLS
jgi:putative chitinase